MTAMWNSLYWTQIKIKPKTDDQELCCKNQLPRKKSNNVWSKEKKLYHFISNLKGANNEDLNKEENDTFCKFIKPKLKPS